MNDPRVLGQGLAWMACYGDATTGRVLISYSFNL